MNRIIRKFLFEKIEDGKVICDSCSWEWKLSEGGDDKYVCHKCGHDNTPKGNFEKVLDRFLPVGDAQSKKTSEYIRNFIKQIIQKKNYTVKFLPSTPLSYSGVRTKDQIIIVEPSAMQTLGDFLYVIFHEMRHEEQVSEMEMDNPFHMDLDDFENLYDQYWKMELDADQFAKNMLKTLQEKLNLSDNENLFSLSPYIEKYGTLSKVVKSQLKNLIDDIKKMKEKGEDFEDIQDHPIIKNQLAKLEDFT